MALYVRIIGISLRTSLKARGPKMDRHDATEESPLLGQSESPVNDAGEYRNGTITNSGDANGAQNGLVKPAEDEESQKDGREDATQYQGMPEVKAKLAYILPAISIGIFLAAADQTIIVSCYGKIGSDLNALNNTSWVATAYFITLTSFQPLYGKLSDIFGRKACILFAYTIFGVGCLFCGLARNMNELIAARTFAGIGGGGMTTVISILMSDIVPLRERGTWQGIINIIYATGAGCGAPLGGLLADTISWRWAFLAQAPMCAIAFLSVAIILKLPKQEVSDWRTKFRRIDFLGAFVLVAAVSTMLLGLDWGSNHGWSQTTTIVSLCLSLPLFIAFVCVELKVAVDPFAPGRIIFERSLVACYLCNFFSFAGWLGVIFYLPLFFQAVDELSASQAGLRLLPGIVAGVSGSLFGGVVMQKTGRYYWLTVIAYTTLTIGIIPILLCSGIVLNSTYGIAVGLVLCGFSNGIGVTTSLIGLIANASTEDQAVATACSYLFRSLGSVIGLSLSATVVQQSLRTQLRDRLRSGKDADQIVKRVRESLEYIKSLDPEIQVTVRHCYGIATRNGFALMLVLVSFAMISSWFIREKRLTR
uniref:MFS transporter n=1 Tax=Cladonia macilenta TaxID=196765 RepID=A0A8F2VW59_9LECA|nr:MFS transporter [Cladonia macilenta]